jgi:hypothetical protein
MSLSPIFQAAPSALRTESTGPVFSGAAQALRVRAPGPIFVGDTTGVIPGSALSAPALHVVSELPPTALSQPAQHTSAATPTTALSQPAQHIVDDLPGRASGAINDHWTTTGGNPDTGPVLDHVVADLPGLVVGTIFDHPVEFKVAGIPGKQIATGARGIATANIVDDAVTSTKLAAGAVDATALAAAAFGNGLAGGGGAVVTVDPDTGITVGASGVAFDVAANLTMSGTHSHTPDTLQVTGTPDSANDAVNKAFVDNALTGLSWLPPVHVKELVGSVATIVAINALTPTLGDAYVSLEAGTPTAVGSDTIVIGSLIEWDGAKWLEIVAGSGGFVPVGFRALASIQTALNGTLGLTDATDEGSVLEWDGTNNTPAKTAPDPADAVLVTDQDADGDSVYANLGYTFSGAIGATALWTQFTGAGQINAGTGLTKDGNTINAIGGTGITANANDLAFDAAAVDGDGLTGSGSTLAVEPDTTTGGGVSGLSVGANGVGIAAQGNGLTGGGGALLAVEPDTTTGGGAPGIAVGANGVGLTAQGNGLTGGAGALLSVQKDTTGAAGLIADAVALNVNSTGLSIDADKLEINFAPGNYTPTDVTETDDAGQLSAHLNGINLALTGAGGAPTPLDKNVQPAATSGDAQDTTANITGTPQSDSYVAVLVNGVQVYLADDNTERATADCYFSADGGTTARAIEDIAAADSLYWNGAQAGYDLDTNDVLDLNYNV